MASVKELLPVRKIGLHHIAFYRAFFENTLNLADIADQYLETGRNLVDARHTLILVQDALLVVGARKGKAPEQLALLKLPASVRKSVTETQKMLDRLRAIKNQVDGQVQEPDSAVRSAPISFDDFIATFDPDNVLGQEEQLSFYYAEVGGSLTSATEEAKREDRERLALVSEPDDLPLSVAQKALQTLHVKNLERRLVIINELAFELTSNPTLDDPVAGWFHPKIANKLIRAQLDTLGKLVDFANEYGWWWFKHVKGLGQVTAVKLTTWLSQNEHFLEKQIYQHVLKKSKDLQGGVITRIRPPVTLPDEQGAATDSGVFVEGSHQIEPLESLCLPARLDGQQGTNRAPARNNRLAAQNDYEAIHEWLALYKTHTYQSYRKEAERLLLWSLFNMQKPLSSLTTADLALFRDFLCNPQPASLWVARRKFARTHEKWRPFVNPNPPPDEPAALMADPSQEVELKGSMSRESIAHTLTVLGGLFEFLTSQQYLLSNPFKGLPKLASNRSMRVNHRINQRLWQRIQDRLDQVPVADTVAYRTVFAIRLFYLTGLRLSELCAIKMEDFHVQENDEGYLAWYLIVDGKGGRTRDVYLVKPVLELLQQYLTALGLELDPRLNEAALPLIGYKKWVELGPEGEGRIERTPVYHTVIYADIKRFLSELAKELENDAPFDAQVIRSITPHWLRHTFASMLVKTTPLAQVRDMLGHASIHTTSLYLGTEKGEGEKAMERAFV
ncbi:tyrosine-type recombinase/integrase [Advenella mimigardefordensis]|uniref:Putative phage integrase family protein n=1 Tax=Advenella mimigardefordensis (strain DSM 17166 / LMG 22922 / DPN7) TaxID=1247726 RepID=W0PKX2_ADVMD|nr:tyrosine-type recombinase/integrase [Advenella mimigardefordensis]AHG66180.1 putative phage integrase family protein [Advenella mimigardefordensis DPN7]